MGAQDYKEAVINHKCNWCRKEIDPTKHPFVLRTEPSEEGRFTYRYHARACYAAWREFVDLHAYQPLDPDTHDHTRS